MIKYLVLYNLPFLLSVEFSNCPLECPAFASLARDGQRCSLALQLELSDNKTSLVTSTIHNLTQFCTLITNQAYRTSKQASNVKFYPGCWTLFSDNFQTEVNSIKVNDSRSQNSAKIQVTLATNLLVRSTLELSLQLGH